MFEMQMSKRDQLIMGWKGKETLKRWIILLNMMATVTYHKYNDMVYHFEDIITKQLMGSLVETAVMYRVMSVKLS